MHHLHFSVIWCNFCIPFSYLDLGYNFQWYSMFRSSGFDAIAICARYAFAFFHKLLTDGSKLPYHNRYYSAEKCKYMYFNGKFLSRSIFQFVYNFNVDINIVRLRATCMIMSVCESLLDGYTLLSSSSNVTRYFVLVICGAT